MKKNIFLLAFSLINFSIAFGQSNFEETSGGWTKYENNPVLGGGDLGTIFDVCVLGEDAELFEMYCSWRPQKSIAYTKSKDGLAWSIPEICLSFDQNTSWQHEVNRPYVIKKDDFFHMWYTGQNHKEGRSWIGYASSADGRNWIKLDRPVIIPDLPWEGVAVMCPDVIWDEEAEVFKMWYSGGEQYEPDAIGYASSKDGINWDKHGDPVFVKNINNEWEQDKVTACHVIKRKNDYLMFYIGFKNVHFAQIGMARSKDGITNWERFKENPIIRPGSGPVWDADAVYKPFAVIDLKNNRWLLYYNGRHGAPEMMGVAIHNGLDLGF